MKLPLEGIRVVEFVHMVMGPSCGLVLGDLGAEVIKIEPTPDGDPGLAAVTMEYGVDASSFRNSLTK